MGNFEKKYVIQSDEKSVFDALTNATIVGQWSGSPAQMSDNEGENFSLWGGSIIGINEKVSSGKLSQLWKEKKWEVYSKVEFEWESTEDGVEVVLRQTGIPDEAFESIKQGWDEHYMFPLKSLLESNNL